MRLANHNRMVPLSRKIRSNVGSMVVRSSSVSLTSKTIRGRAAICLHSEYWKPPSLGRALLRALRMVRHHNTKVPDRRGDFGGVRFQREVPGVEEADECAWNIPLEGFGSRGQEEWVVLAPNRQQRRLMRSEISLELRVESDVAGIVEQQIKLRLVRSRAGQIMVIQRAAIGRHER